MTTGKGPQRVSEPRRPRRRSAAAVRVLASLFVLLVLAGAIAGGLAWYGYDAYSSEGPLAASKVYDIDRGLGTADIGARLEQQGIISSGRVFAAAAYVTGVRGRLKAGEYEFPAHASMRDVMNLLVSGKVIVYKISIPEGFTSDMALARIAADQVLTGEVTSPPAEGTLMPDTYLFPRGKTRQQLIEDMQAAETKMVDDIWTRRRDLLPITTREEAVILASIVEKETALADERPLIASVFVNRLRKGMRLQSDPTIIYGIAGGKGKLDRPLTHADITTPTPYNTYTIDGLPPGPIANPGRAALEAVVNPPETSYLYFVANGSGGHAFASTLEEHNRNVAKWRDLAGNAATAAAVDAATAATANATSASSTATATALPSIESTRQEAANNSAAAAADISTAAKSGPDIMANAEPADTAKPAEAKPVDVKPADAAATTTPPVAVLKPGSVIKIGNRLVPIPKRKPKR